MFRQRLITGVLYVGFIIWMIFSLPRPGFDLVFAVITCFAMLEWMSVIQLEKRWIRVLLLDSFILLMICLFWFKPFDELVLWLGVGLWACLVPFLIWQQTRVTLLKMNTPSLVIIGLIILLAMFFGMTQVMIHSGPYHVMMLVMIPWVSDTFAYLTGRLIGKHRLISHISPGKTWEGVAGGLIASLVIIPLYAHFVLDKTHMDLLFFLAIVILVSIAIVGDLFESYVKRVFGLKDSGNVLPGHGGILDRLDSLIAVAPCFMVLTQLGWL